MNMAQETQAGGCTCTGAVVIGMGMPPQQLNPSPACPVHCECGNVLPTLEAVARALRAILSAPAAMQAPTIKGLVRSIEEGLCLECGQLPRALGCEAPR